VAENTPIPARKAIKDRKQPSHSLLGTYLIKLVSGTCSLPRHRVAARVGSEMRLWDDLQSVPIRSLVHEGLPNGVATRKSFTRRATACRAPQAAATVKRIASAITIYAEREMRE
jgi:hypothetical protein